MSRVYSSEADFESKSDSASCFATQTLCLTLKSVRDNERRIVISRHYRRTLQQSLAIAVATTATAFQLQYNTSLLSSDAYDKWH